MGNQTELFDNEKEFVDLESIKETNTSYDDGELCQSWQDNPDKLCSSWQDEACGDGSSLVPTKTR